MYQLNLQIDILEKSEDNNIDEKKKIKNLEKELEKPDNLRYDVAIGFMSKEITEQAMSHFIYS